MSQREYAFLPADDRAALDATRDEHGLRPQRGDEARRRDDILWTAHALSGAGGWIAFPAAARRRR